MEKTETGKSRSLPLSSRPVDILFVLWYVVYFFTVMITDYHNFTASYMGITTYELEKVDLVWPPKIISKVYYEWGHTADPLLLANPPFFQALEWVNLVFSAPFSLAAVYAFLKGKEWIRNAALLNSPCVFFSIVICASESILGEFPSPDLPMFLAMYIPYAVFPLLVIWRLWSDHPFTSHSSAARSLLLAFIAVVVFTYFFLYVGLWFLKYGDRITV